jgi:hypothetical protein
VLRHAVFPLLEEGDEPRLRQCIRQVREQIDADGCGTVVDSGTDVEAVVGNQRRCHRHAELNRP